MIDTSHLSQRELRTFAEVLAIVAQAVIADRIACASTVRADILAHDDAVEVAEAVDTWLADDAGDGGAQ